MLLVFYELCDSGSMEKEEKKQSSNQMTTRMSHVGAHISISSAENAMGTRGV
jgi:hypothetical protein